MKKTPQEYANDFCALYKRNLMSIGLDDTAANFLINVLATTLKQFVSGINNPMKLGGIKPKGKFSMVNNKEN